MNIKKLIKKSALAFTLVVSCRAGWAQNYVWMHGSNQVNQLGVYGTKGVASPNNTPGARFGACTWKDSNGNFWLFGGSAMSASNPTLLPLANDLWKYNPTTNEWTWISGSNLPSQHSVYSGLGVASATHAPGARRECGQWMDAAGNVWLFGGFGYSATGSAWELNDLWKYNMATNEWTCYNAYQSGAFYGTLGTGSALNRPGGRRCTVAWGDAAGNGWVFGGLGFDNAGTYNGLNDIWKYDITTNTWTWMDGGNLASQPGVYGTQGIATSSATPGGRWSMAVSYDGNGHLLMFGGYGKDASSGTQQTCLNDLWRYDMGSQQWTWLGGSSTGQPLGIYGTQGVPGAANIPGGRQGTAYCTDAAGNLYLFGGHGNSTTYGNELNDLWKYDKAGNQWTWLKGANTNGQTGTYGTIGVPAATNQPGARNSASGWVDATGNVWMMGGVKSGSILAAFNDLWKLELCTSAPALTVATSQSVICAGNQATLSASGGALYGWNGSPAGSASTQVISPAVTTTYAVIGIDANGCSSSMANIVQVVTVCTGIEETSTAGLPPLLYPNPNNGAFSLSGNWPGKGTLLVVHNTLGQLILEKELDAPGSPVQTSLSPGLYYYSILYKSAVTGNGKLKVE